MTGWLIDEDGEVWPADSEQLRLKLGFAARPVEEHSRFLVVNRGFALLQRQHRGLLLHWRPTFVKAATFIVLIKLLKEERDSRVLIATMRDDWGNTLCASLASARMTLLKEFETAKCERGGYFDALPKTAEALDPKSPLGRTLREAVAASFKFDAVDLWQLLSNVALNRYILLEPHQDANQTKVIAIGNGYDISRDWVREAAGHGFLNQPDAAYARAAASAYWPTMSGGNPLIEDINASIWWAGCGRREVSYTRLVLPVKVAGRPLLLSVSQPLGAR